jgi:hypothetical protein
LRKEDYVVKKKGSYEVDARVRVSVDGLVVFNRSAVMRLGLEDGCGVSFSEDVSSRNCFAVGRDDERGYVLRGDGYGRLMFNCVELSRHVLRCSVVRMALAAGSVVPSYVVFVVAGMPIEENSNIFALIMKK